MKLFGTVATLAFLTILSGCAAKTVKPDPYAEAASAKRAEIDRLSKQIAEMRAKNDSASFSRRIDSLESVKAIAQASLGGIYGVVVEEQKRQADNLQGAGLIAPPSDSAMNKEYPITRY